MITGEELAAYAAGEADPALVARVESALPGDLDLAARLARLRELDDVLAGLGPVAMTEDETARLSSAIDVELARLAGTSAVGEGADPTTAAAGSGADSDAPTEGAVVDLAAHRGTRGGPSRRSRGDAVREWFDPMRLAGVAAALVVVGVVGALVANGFGGGEAEFASMDAGAAVGADSAQSEAMMPLPTGTAEALEESGETAAAADMATEAATEAAGSAAPIPIIDDQRVVPEADDIDPTVLRQRLEPLVDLGAIDEPQQDVTREETEAAGGSDAVGIADGRVSAADAEAVDACLPTDLPVIVAEVIVLAPSRAAIAYVLADRVLVVDAVTCGTVAELVG